LTTKKIWRPSYDLNEQIEAFTVGKDPELDQNLVIWDCLGSIAHAVMLESIGILNPKELALLKAELIRVMSDVEEGTFSVRMEHEDVHAAVESRLIERLGETGKKIHTARSRNDQILVDLRLFGKAILLELERDLLRLCHALVEMAEANQGIPMVGRTHAQRAMPSSVGLWAGSFLESLLDDREFLLCAYKINDQCPLGSAASYGVPLAIDRKKTAQLLGFSKVQNNVLYVNNSRGKIDSIILSACVQIMQDLAKMAQELILFSMPEFGYFQIPEELCTGSSIMPQKKNPCALELTRAKSATVLSDLFRILEITRTLPTGYNRDGQETKEPFMEGLFVTLACVRVMELTIRELKVCEDNLLAGFHPEVFATDKVLEVVASGVPFREAYERVKRSLDSLGQVDPAQKIKERTHQGASGNLGLAESRLRMEQGEEDRRSRAQDFVQCMEKLSGAPVPVLLKKIC